MSICVNKWFPHPPFLNSSPRSLLDPLEMELPCIVKTLSRIILIFWWAYNNGHWFGSLHFHLNNGIECISICIINSTFPTVFLVEFILSLLFKTNTKWVRLGIKHWGRMKRKTMDVVHFSCCRKVFTSCSICCCGVPRGHTEVLCSNNNINCLSFTFCILHSLILLIYNSKIYITWDY